jgi:hypothetical protein
MLIGLEMFPWTTAGGVGSVSEPNDDTGEAGEEMKRDVGGRKDQREGGLISFPLPSCSVYLSGGGLLQ